MMELLRRTSRRRQSLVMSVEGPHSSSRFFRPSERLFLILVSDWIESILIDIMPLGEYIPATKYRRKKNILIIYLKRDDQVFLINQILGQKHQISFKIVAGEVEEFIRKGKQSRQEDLKKMKGMYRQLATKQESPFESTLERIKNNLHSFKQSHFRDKAQSISLTEMVEMHTKKIQDINKEIIKMQNILEKGCGTVRMKKREEGMTENLKQVKQKNQKQEQTQKVQIQQ